MFTKENNELDDYKEAYPVEHGNDYMAMDYDDFTKRSSTSPSTPYTLPPEVIIDPSIHRYLKSIPKISAEPESEPVVGNMNLITLDSGVCNVF